MRARPFVRRAPPPDHAVLAEQALKLLAVGANVGVVEDGEGETVLQPIPCVPSLQQRGIVVGWELGRVCVGGGGRQGAE